MQKLKLSIIALFVAAGVGMVSAPTYVAACSSAADCVQDGVDDAGGTGSKVSLGNLIKTVVNVLLYILGAIAVIMIVIGGLRYVISGGDASQVQSAKNTILYALVGIIVAILAYAAVNFVVNSFVPGASSTGTSGSNFGASSR